MQNVDHIKSPSYFIKTNFYSKIPHVIPDYSEMLYYGFSYQFCDRSKWNVISAETTNLQAAAIYLEEDVHAESFFVDQARQRFLLPQVSFNDDNSHDDDCSQEDNDELN